MKPKARWMAAPDLGEVLLYLSQASKNAGKLAQMTWQDLA